MQAKAALILVAALLALTPPLLLAFSHPVAVIGVPLMYVWLFLAWPVLVLLGALASRGLQ